MKEVGLAWSCWQSPFWLKPFLLEHHIVYACGERFSAIISVFLTSFCIFFLSCTMVRKGWSNLEVPNGWLKVVRGVRPPSEKWPRAGSQQQRRQPVGPAPVTRAAPPLAAPTSQLATRTIASGCRSASCEDASFYRGFPTRRHGGIRDAPASSHKSATPNVGANVVETRCGHRSSQKERSQCSSLRGRRKFVAEVEGTGDRNAGTACSSSKVVGLQ